MSFVAEFKEFAMRGSVVDLAVGVVIGAAFGKIVSSLVENVVMPPIGILIGGVDFSELKWVLQPAVDAAATVAARPEVAIGYGAFINSVIQFLLIAFAIFMVVKVINRLKRTVPPPPAAPTEPSLEAQLLAEIRDALKARGDALPFIAKDLTK